MCRVGAMVYSVLLAGLVTISCNKVYNTMEEAKNNYNFSKAMVKSTHISKSNEIKSIVTEEPTETVEIEEVVEEFYISDDEINLLALVTMAEAEGECEDGQRLVIDTILNRMDSEYFPDSISEVIYQPGQFTSMWNGRADRCYISDDICQLVREELNCRTNYDVMFFTANNYGDYGVPMFAIGNHYFSSYE